MCVRDGGFSGVFILLELLDCCCCCTVASEPSDRGGDAVLWLEARLGNLTSSITLDLDGLWLAVRDGVSLSRPLEVLDFGVSGLAVFADFVSSSFLERKLEDDRLDSARIRIFCFPSLGLSSWLSLFFSCRSPTVLPFRED